MTHTTNAALAAVEREKQRVHARRWRQRNPGELYKVSRKWKLGNLEKKRAHDTVRKAIKRGALKRLPCERCGTTLRVQAHHDDYTKRLAVMWLCPVHHKERHRELEAAQ